MKFRESIPVIVGIAMLLAVSDRASALTVKKVVMRYQMAAHVTMGQKMPKVDTTSTFYFSDSEVRIDQPDMILLYDLESDSWKTLYPKQEIYFQGMPGELMQKMRSSGQSPGIFAGHGTANFSVKHSPTADTATINGYLCTKHVLDMTTSGMSSTSEIWMTEEISIDPQLSHAVFGTGQGNQAYSEAYRKAISEMSGFMVKSITTAGIVSSAPVITTIESFEEVEVPDNYFEIPDYYDIYPAPAEAE